MTVRLTDARTGETVELGPRSVRMRLLVTPAGDVRASVVADALRRTAELTGRTTTVCVTGDAVDLTAYGVPPADHAGPPHAHADERVEVEVLAGRAATADGGGQRCLLMVGPVTGDAEPDDPLALRLLLLATPREAPVEVSAARLAEAARRLAGWRRSVARWAESPSAPVAADYVGPLTGALADDLDLPAVLGVLDTVATDEAVPPGARFETFAWADRVLALELVREVGTQRSETPR